MRLAHPFSGLLLCCAALVASVFPCVSHAAVYPTYTAAMAACQSNITPQNFPPPLSGACQLAADTGVYHNVQLVGTADKNKGQVYGTYSYTGDIAQVCQARPSYQTFSPGNLTLCMAGCSYAPAPGKETWSVRGITGGTSKVGSGKMNPTGSVCGAGPVAAAEPPPKDEPTSNLCGGGSCHDTSAGKFCAVDGGGNQVCVPDKPGKNGACMSSGDTTLCVGNPAPTPPNPPISDPASQIASSDHYTSQTDNGPIDNSTVNNYNNTGNGANPGKGAGDVDGKGDKPDDQKKDDGTTASGGGDCTTPPMVEGSAALGMIAKQDWLLRCQLPDWAKVNDGDGDKYNTGTPVSSGDVFKSESTGTEGLDQTSWAGNTCPDLGSVQVFGMSWSPDTTLFCRWIAIIRAVVLVAGAFLSCVILAQGSK